MKTKLPPGMWKSHGHCNKCREDKDIIGEDVGIGPFEFWGAKGIDVRYIYYCSECGSEDVKIWEEER